MARASAHHLLMAQILFAVATNWHLPSAAAETVTDQPCNSCIRIRVGLPHVARGPAADMADNHFTEVQMPGGGFRGFDAHGDTRAIDGRHPWDMGGPARIVLRAGQPGTYDSCGQWLNHAERAGATVLGFIHDETACHYQANFQTHMSTSLAVSTDYGLTWKSYGQILTGTDMPTANKQTGEGSCSTVNGQDGYYYAYCFRNRDGALIVARGPVSDPQPGKWMKFFQGNWDQPGLGGQATRLMNGSGVSAARWTTTGQTVLTGWVHGGLGLFVSSDHTTLTPLPEPLLAVDPGEWKRPAPSELIFYPVILDATTGANQLANSWMLVYAYMQPNEAGSQKYLVFRDVTVSTSDAPDTAQVGVLLARWYNAGLHDRWSTTAAVPGNDTTYKLEARSGFLMTTAPIGKPSTELEDCVSERPGHPDHLLAQKGFCEAHAYQRLRTAGWVYARQETNTQPLYQCYSDGEASHFASNRPDCEGKGRMETLLGYDLVQ
jgi:hypothetical protein